MRPRPAPSAAQTASARWRVTPRASSKPATLLHAISSTSAIAAVSASSAGRCSRAISSRNRITWTSCTRVSPVDPPKARRPARRPAM